MDQGLAAILGAAVGATATGAAALVTAMSTSRLTRHRARREACLAYLTLVAEIRMALADVGRHYRPDPNGLHEPLDATTARDRVAGIDARHHELVTKHAVLMLAGPRRVYQQAVRTSDLVGEPLLCVTRWAASGAGPSGVTGEEIRAFDRAMEALAKGLAQFADTAREST